MPACRPDVPDPRTSRPPPDPSLISILSRTERPSFSWLQDNLGQTFTTKRRHGTHSSVRPICAPAVSPIARTPSTRQTTLSGACRVENLSVLRVLPSLALSSLEASTSLRVPVNGQAQALDQRRSRTTQPWLCVAATAKPPQYRLFGHDNHWALWATTECFMSTSPRPCARGANLRHTQRPVLLVRLSQSC